MSVFFTFMASTASKWAYSISIFSGTKSIRCEKCSSLDEKIIAPLMLTLDGGKKYPDILLCGSWPYLIVSQKTLDAWQKNNITGFISTPVIIDKKGREEHEIPSYYLITIEGRCEFDLGKMGVPILTKCKNCNKIKLSKNLNEVGKIYLKSEPDADIFISEIVPYRPFCSEKIIRIASKEKLTNFSFTRGEDSFDYFAPTIDYLKY